MDERWIGLPGGGGSGPPGEEEAALVRAAAACNGHPGPVVEHLRSTGGELVTHGSHARFELLASVAAVDLAAARTLEPHLDALDILRQAGLSAEPGAAWGVYAAESASGRLTATSAPGSNASQATTAAAVPGSWTTPDGDWILEGTKPWCSLAGVIDRAVVTAHVDGGRRAFSVDLAHPGVAPDHSGWAGHGLPSIPSGPVRFRQVPASPVGATGWYLTRPGFAGGGIGVAACWFGGAVGLFRTLLDSAHRRTPDQLALAWIGEADRLLAAAAALLGTAAPLVDSGAAGWTDAHRVRGHVAAACTRVLEICGQAMGPSPLAFDAAHARRVADLTLYIRQHHGSRDDAELGRLVLERERAW
ncbi:acyl-CoA dehydrogenase [Zafaria sp. Z1313]|uniref:acyl-CoA dehydrogenase n=1 Tax=Zafaria sp. Z1313 TaxID=3423202 RepID=UPI003D3025B4